MNRSGFLLPRGHWVDPHDVCIDGHRINVGEMRVNYRPDIQASLIPDVVSYSIPGIFNVPSHDYVVGFALDPMRDLIYRYKRPILANELVRYGQIFAQQVNAPYPQAQAKNCGGCRGDSGPRDAGVLVEMAIRFCIATPVLLFAYGAWGNCAFRNIDNDWLFWRAAWVSLFSFLPFVAIIGWGWIWCALREC